MQKDELILLVKQMCDNLVDLINENDDAPKAKVVSYMHESAHIIAETEDDPTSISNAKLYFENVYQEIANQSLLSYGTTNDRFEELAEMQKKTLLECSHSQIDLPAITEKFSEIQAHMSDEIKKANDAILTLTRQIKTLEAKTNLDPLTKVLNRRALMSNLKAICNMPIADNLLHVLILDIDDFKQINDRYGHIAGDKILIFIANILRKTLREGDKIFRYGGEEFVIILNRIDDSQCFSISTRLLELVRNNQLIYQGQSLNVTVSIGATKIKTGDTPDSLIDRADKALYQAKKSGKNQLLTEI